MWRAETTLWLVVGAHHIACGQLVRGNGAASGFQHFCNIQIEQDSSGEASGGPQDAWDAMLRAMAVAWRGAEESLSRLKFPNHMRRTLRVWVSDRWAPVLTLPWNFGLGRADSAYVQQHFHSAGFEVTSQDLYRRTDSGFRKPIVAVAYGAEMLTALTHGAQRLEAKLGSVQPLGEAVWRATRKQFGQPSALALIDDRRISLFYSQPGSQSWTPGQCMDLDTPAGGEKAAEVLWRRQQLRRPQLSGFVKLIYLDLVSSLAPANSASVLNLEALISVPCSPTELDVIQRVPRLSMMRAVSVGVAAALAAVAVTHTAATQRTLNAQQQVLAARESAHKPPVPKTWTEAERKRIQAVNGAIRELNLPLPELAQAMLPPKDIGVALVALNIAPMRSDGSVASKLSITVEAASAIDMTRYVSFLSERASLAQPHLVSHEILDSDPMKPYRFIVEMSWQN